MTDSGASCRTGHPPLRHSSVGSDTVTRSLSSNRNLCNIGGPPPRGCVPKSRCRLGATTSPPLPPGTPRLGLISGADRMHRCPRAVLAAPVLALATIAFVAVPGAAAPARAGRGPDASGGADARAGRRQRFVPGDVRHPRRLLWAVRHLHRELLHRRDGLSPGEHLGHASRSSQVRTAWRARRRLHSGP